MLLREGSCVVALVSGLILTPLPFACRVWLLPILFWRRVRWSERFSRVCEAGRAFLASSTCAVRPSVVRANPHD